VSSTNVVSQVAATPAILAINGNKINSLSADKVACSGRRRRRRRRRDDVAATDGLATIHEKPPPLHTVALSQ
jgi:hypothetical protein